MSNYAQLVQKLFEVNLHGGMKFGLTNTRILDKTLGYPSKSFPTVHIAGSNGKGSVATKIATALEHTGLRVGLYTSPHISSFRERIKINGKMIPESVVEELLSHLFSLTENENIPATFFELTTMLAFKYFAQEKIDFGIIEVGLGGRLDATNIVTPKVSIITSISLEHTDILGNSLELISREKGGIIKPDVPTIIGPRVISPVIKSIAEEHNSPLIQVTGTYPIFDEENQAIAKKTLEYLQVPSESISVGLSVRPPCRMEIHLRPNPIILDVAHNPDGLSALVKAVKHKYPGKTVRIVCGLSSNKDIIFCLASLKGHFTHYHFVEAKNNRAMPARYLGNAMQRLGIHSSDISVHPKIEDGILNALKSNEIVVVSGTFFIMSEVRKALEISEPFDLVDMNEQKL